MTAFLRALCTFAYAVTPYSPPVVIRHPDEGLAAEVESRQKLDASAIAVRELAERVISRFGGTGNAENAQGSARPVS